GPGMVTFDRKAGGSGAPRVYDTEPGAIRVFRMSYSRLLGEWLACAWPCEPEAVAGPPCEPQPKARRVCERGRASRSRRRGESVNSAMRPPGLARVAPVLVALLVVWVAGGLWLARRGAERHEVAVADTVAAVRALVDAAQRELRRESALLAKDPTIVE